MEMSTLTNAAKITATFLKADHGPVLHRYAKIAGVVVAYAITVALIAADCAYALGQQTRAAIEERNDQLAAMARFILEFTDGITLDLEFPEIAIPAVVPVLAAASGPIALLAAAPAPARKPRTRKAATPATTTATPARKPRARKTASKVAA